MKRLNRPQKVVAVITLAVVGIALISGGCRVTVDSTLRNVYGDALGLPDSYSYTDWGQTTAFILGVLVLGAALTLALGWLKKRPVDRSTIEAPGTGEPSTVSSVGDDDAKKAKGIAWLSYLGILWLIPLLTLKDNAFAKFHVKQGIMLTILWVASSVIAAIPIIGWVADLVIWVLALIMMIMGIIYSLKGKCWKMPIVGKWAADWFKF